MAQFEWNDEAETKFSEMFEQLDKDGSGKLTFDEIRNGGLQQGASAVGGPDASEEDIINFIETVDKDADGEVSKDEFRQFLIDFFAMLQEQINQAQEEHAQREEEEEIRKFEWDDDAEEKFQEMFHEMDKDGSGTLVFDEIKSGSLKKCSQIVGHNPTDEEVFEFIDLLDRDGDGIITQDEFRQFLKDFIEKLQNPKLLLKEAVDTMMKSLDKNGNGLCEKEEFRAFLKERGAEPLTDEEVDELFSEVNIDGDSTTLNKDELLIILQEGLAN